MNITVNDTHPNSSGELHFNNSQIIIEYSDILPTQFLSEKINGLLNEFLLFCPDQSKIRTSFNWDLEQWNVTTEVNHNLKSFYAEAIKINPFDALKDAIEKLKTEIRDWRKDRYGSDATYSRDLKVVKGHGQHADSKIKVLLIDDDPITVKLIESCFRQQGCDTMIATNGVDAVRMFENMNYDLIVLDWIMPDLNGEEVIKQGEQNINHSMVSGEDFVKIPVLTYSAHGYQDINFPETTHFTQLGHIKKTTTYKRLRNKTNVIVNRVKKLKYSTALENRT